MRKLFNQISDFMPNRRDIRGRTPLYKAAKHGNLKRVEELLAADADPNIANVDGLTPLHQAAHWGEYDIVKALLAAGADPMADNGHGWTPLHSAALSAGLVGRRRVIQALLKLGADPHAPDEHGWTAADYAELWKGRNPRLTRVLEHLRRLSSDRRDDPQQPDMKKLGLDKNPTDQQKKNSNAHPTPPPHHADFAGADSIDDGHKSKLSTLKKK